MQTTIPFLISLAAFMLAMSGILGIAVNLFYENGLVNFLLGKIWNLETHYIVTAVPIAVSVVVLGQQWNNAGLNKGTPSLSANTLLLLVMAAGGYFIYLFLTTGSLAYQPPF